VILWQITETNGVILAGDESDEEIGSRLWPAGFMSFDKMVGYNPFQRTTDHCRCLEYV
jgi:hypothetical protein